MSCCLFLSVGYVCFEHPETSVKPCRPGLAGAGVASLQGRRHRIVEGRVVEECAEVIGADTIEFLLRVKKNSRVRLLNKRAVHYIAQSCFLLRTTENYLS